MKRRQQKQFKKSFLEVGKNFRPLMQSYIFFSKTLHIIYMYLMRIQDFTGTTAMTWKCKKLFL